MPDASPQPGRRRRRGLGLAALTGLSLVATPLAAAPVSAAPAGDALVISEVFARGGSAGAAYSNRYVELYNPTGAEIALGGLSIQYRSATGTAAPTTTVPLTGAVPAGGHFLLAGASNGTSGAALPAADQSANGLNMAAAGGTLFLVDGVSPLAAPPTGAADQPDAVLDLVGYGSSNTYESAVATAPSLTQTIARAETTTGDTDVNAADFASAHRPRRRPARAARPSRPRRRRPRPPRSRPSLSARSRAPETRPLSSAAPSPPPAWSPPVTRPAATTVT
ncbi:lamin tail domain-containing protein [Rathayibacter tanaceti]|uniref:LTD domain-containing protein n=1 Tax=Rathayibacter tanaceti TaxID=1671680 RepID=A0A162FYC9_9MICO|nr:lamin tail domain-containing protein [Rathayibacter tanaceti]KZX21380.1 hypothetical protein ACH61_01476 [Rathayibacter tanaceti]